MFDLLFNQGGDKVAVGAIFGESDARRLTAFGKWARPVDIQRGLHPGKGKLFAIRRKGVGRIASRLNAMFLVEGGILGTPFEEVPEGSVQMTKGLLKGNARYFRKPGGLFLLLQFSQHDCQLMVVETFAALKESIGTLSQCPVIGVATTAKGTSKDVSLLISWVHPIRVCFLLFHALHASRYIVKRQAPHPSPKQGRARISPVLKDGVLQSVRLP